MVAASGFEPLNKFFVVSWLCLDMLVTLLILQFNSRSKLQSRFRFGSGIITVGMWSTSQGG